MDPNQSISAAKSGDLAAHLQFQSSLLRLMAQKSQKAGSRAVSAVQAPSIQVTQLERLRHPQLAIAPLQTRS